MNTIRSRMPVTVIAAVAALVLWNEVAQSTMTGPVVVLAASADQASEPGSTPPAAQADRASSRAAGPTFYLPIPKPISDRELQRYSRLMTLSEEQDALFQRLHGEYNQRDYEARKKVIEPLRERCRALPVDEVMGTPEGADAYTSLLEELKAANAELRSAELRLFSDLSPYLTEDQLLDLEQVKLLRRRTRANAAISFIPGAREDVIVALDVLAQNPSADMTPSDPELFRTTLFEYAYSVTPLVERRYDLRFKSSLEVGPLQTAQRQLVQNAEVIDDRVRSEAIRIQEEIVAARKPLTSLSLRIHDLNRRYVERIAEMLPRETGKRLVEWWRTEVYSLLFPDPADLAEILDAARDLDSLTDAQRADIEEIIELYSAQYESACDRLIRRYMEWQGECSNILGYDINAAEAYQRQMRTMRAERDAVAAMALELLVASLTPEQLSLIEDQLQSYQERFTAAREEERAGIERRTRGADEWPLP